MHRTLVYFLVGLENSTMPWWTQSVLTVITRLQITIHWFSDLHAYCG